MYGEIGFSNFNAMKMYPFKYWSEEQQDFFGWHILIVSQVFHQYQFLWSYPCVLELWAQLPFM